MNQVTPLSSTGQHLLSFIQRIERLEEEKAELAEQVKEVKSEVKSHGFDVNVLNNILRIRKKDPAKFAEEEALLDTYLAALGMRNDD